MTQEPQQHQQKQPLLPIQRALVVVPTYNEVDNILPLTAALWAAAPNIHVLFVDDSSRDGTLDVIKTVQAQKPECTFLHQRAGKLGLGTAYIAGFRWGLERAYDAIIEMDADLSHNPADVPRLVRLLSSHDAIIGSRYVPGGGTQNWGLLRKVISRFGSLYGRTILDLTIRDLTGGFNAWRREVLETIDIDRVRSEGYAFQIELKYRAVTAGFGVSETPILFTERRAGSSKMSSKIVVEAMMRVWQLRFLRPSFPRLPLSSEALKSRKTRKSGKIEKAG